ncbi:MAG: PaREP1/PaREP8 domain-contain protein [Chloroflexi bacterium]|nr:PaREP1/PaREP8 domain-contain protein [Chloroflexota bacterium]MYD48158.1 PaREP1/PaREP8 domain-contain protein [Chloroflexota bacterium]
MTIPTYQTASQHLLNQARQELALGDTRQASEKGWGAAAQMVKAVAEQRGWEHKTHRHIWTTVRRLTDEGHDAALNRLFRSANHLHSNFYEDIDAPDDVADALNDVERLLNLLAPLA